MKVTCRPLHRGYIDKDSSEKNQVWGLLDGIQMANSSNGWPRKMVISKYWVCMWRPSVNSLYGRQLPLEDVFVNAHLGLKLVFGFMYEQFKLLEKLVI